MRGKQNRFQYSGAHLKNVRFHIEGDRNSIVIGGGSFIENVTVTMRGSGHRLVIGRDAWLYDDRIFFEDQDCWINIGSRVKIVGTKMSAAEPGSKVLFGDDSMCSDGSDIRNTDSHSLINLETGKRFNPGQDVVIGDHVWLGEGVVVLKGVHIGDGTMVAIRSVVTRSIPTNCLVAGNPAKIIRQNTSWKWERI